MTGVRFLLLLSSLVLCISGQDDELTTSEEITTIQITEETTTEEFIECGDSTSVCPFIPDKKIVGGEVVINRQDFSYQASIRYVKNRFPFCGGTIIDETYILTAAHCLVNNKKDVINKNAIFIVVGDLRTDFSTENTLWKEVLNIAVHEEYNTITLQNDIALLKIQSLGKFNPYVKKIELSTTTPAVGTLCIVSGWGTITSNGEASLDLRSVEVPIVSSEMCNTSYFDQIYDGMMCAGYEEGQKDACQGDSGGPLVCNDTLAGVVSWGYNCAAPDYPGIYTDVAQYIDWIKQQKGKSSFKAIHYCTSEFSLVICILFVILF